MKNEFIMSLALAAAMAAPAFAQDAPANAAPGFTAGGGGQGGAGRERRGGGHFAAFEAVLNAQQKAQFKSLMEQSRAEGKPLMEKMRTMRQQMQGGSSMDDKTKAEFIEVRKQLKAHHEGVQSKMMALLTPEQKAQLEKTGGLPTFGEHGGGGGGRSWSGGGAGGWSGRHGRRGGGAGGDSSTGDSNVPNPPGQ
jgi:Spy/CpxP family protein refolding chaperone